MIGYYPRMSEPQSSHQQAQPEPTTSDPNGTRPIRVLLGISGGIAAYKSAELARRLIERGAEVRVVMTEAAKAFITPLTLQALSGHPVRSEFLSTDGETAMDHIALARWADQVLIAPATADLMARLAHGLANDLLTTLVLATEAPLTLAPAMNQQMWLHPATQENLACLQARGVRIIGPAAGSQACGEVGPGRMSEPEEIAQQLLAVNGSAMNGLRVLMTAGPTREPIDPVRFVGNRSSGKMGYALATALLERGARVTLISGPTALIAPGGAEFVRVESALEMDAAVQARVADMDVFIGAAAVADYRPEQTLPKKLKKAADRLSLNLVRNPDILARVAARDAPPFTLGFAAETEQLEANARLKLEHKGLSMIAANQVGDSEGGFESDRNALLCLWRGGRRALPMMPKPALAFALAQLIEERYAAQTAG